MQIESNNKAFNSSIKVNITFNQYFTYPIFVINVVLLMVFVVVNSNIKTHRRRVIRTFFSSYAF